MNTPSALPAGTWIENFRIVRQLGRGGFGVTYVAEEFREWESGGNIGSPLREVAIKEFFPQGLAIRPNGHTVAFQPDIEGAEQTFQQALKSFFQEAESLMRFDHPNVIKIYRVFQRNGTAYYVMPFLHGESLKNILKRDGAMGEERTRRLLLPVLDGLSHAHARGILHRDLKPDNVMVPDEGGPILIDFGAARAQAADDAQQYTSYSELVAYTPGYAAFEQYGRASRENLHGPHTDVYGLAAVFYRCLTGVSPIESSRRVLEVTNGHPDPLTPASVRLMDTPGVGRAFLAAIDWGLEIAGRNRPQNLGDFRKALDGKLELPDALIDRLAVHGVPTEPFTRVVTRPITQSVPMDERSWIERERKRLEAERRALEDLRRDTQRGHRGTQRGDDAPTEILSRPQAASRSEPPTTPLSLLATARYDAPTAGAMPTVPPRPEPPASARTSGGGRAVWVAAALIVVLAVGGYVAFQQGFIAPQPSEPPQPVEPEIAAAPPAAVEPKTMEPHPVPAPAPSPAKPEPAAAEKSIAEQTTLERPETKPDSPQPDTAVRVEPETRTEPEPARRAAIPEPAPSRPKPAEKPYVEPPAAVVQAEPQPRAAPEPAPAPARPDGAEAEWDVIPRVAGAFRDCPGCPQMLRIPGGRFEMGDVAGNGESDEKPVHAVAVESFAASAFEVTFDEWAVCAKAGGCSGSLSDAGWGRGSRPAINVSWNDAQSYAAWLSSRSGRRYRLPSEAEFEYLNRAGRRGAFPWGEDDDAACAMGNVADRRARTANPEWATFPCDDGEPLTAPVGSYSPNAFGLFDVAGNVWEWTQDCYHNYKQAPIDGSAFEAPGCGRRVVRGGSWSDAPRNLRVSDRSGGAPSSRLKIVGFRVVRDG